MFEKVCILFEYQKVLGPGRTRYTFTETDIW